MSDPAHEPDSPDQPSRGRSLADRFPALKRLERTRRRRRVPFVQQTTSADCGAACLAMVLSYHGREVRLEELRNVAGTDRDGTNALSLVNAARWYGLRGRGISLDTDALPYLDPGSILHWGFHHFVVYEGQGRGRVDIVDPDFGRRRVDRDEFDRMFTGVALVFEPTDSFETGSDTRGRAWKYVRQILAQSGLLRRILVISALVQLFGLGLPVLTGIVVDKVIPRQDYHLLYLVGVGLGAIVLFGFLASYLRSHLLIQLRTHLDAHMTLGFLDHLVSLPYLFFQKRSTGDLIMRMNSNTTVREILTSSALSGALDGMLVVSYLILLLIVSLPLGLLVLVLGLARVLVFALARRRIRELMSESLQRQADSQSFQVQMLSGIETLKAMGAEYRAVDSWSNLYVDVLNVSIARGRLNALIQSVLSTLSTGSPLIILGAGALLVLDGQLTIGTMLAMSALAVGFLGPLSSLVSTATQLQELGSYLDRLDDVLETPPEQNPAEVRPAPTLEGRVTMEKVSFRYGPTAPLVVQDISLDILPGQMVAIVGRSAAGKSTLAGLVMGLYQPVGGRVLYDGTDLGTLEVHSVRRQLGIVTQNAYLFGASIRENIALSDPDLTLDDIQDAARLAHIHDEIMAMPMNYETPLVDGGMSLSGGQRQRIALARALVRRPAVLLLDEATSALDATTERQIQRSLAGIECTRIVVAHRLSTVMDADLIVVMEEGRVVEAGTHDELVARDGVYRELLGSQLQKGTGDA